MERFERNITSCLGPSAFSPYPPIRQHVTKQTLYASTTLLFFSAATLTLSTVTRAQPQQDHQHRNHHRDTLVAAAAKRQPGPAFAAAAGPAPAPAPSGSSGSSTSPQAASAAPAAALTTTGSAAHGTGASTTPSSSAASGTGMTGSGSGSTPVPTGPNGVPPLSLISSGMPTGTPSPVATTYTPGATPPISGAPVLPAQFMFNSADWPTQDKIPDTTSDEVQTWMQELNGFDIPSWTPTADGTCAGDPAAAAEASARGWWTCGWTTRDTDITACPKMLDWGVSFDDGPSPWSEKLLNYLGTKSILATFFVVGSRVVERPAVLIEEYMAGHEISPLTAMTNEQIVAELGWTRKAIQAVLGVTPTTMRPPFGDIDDRVRAISLAMGMVPIIWTNSPTSGPFDTNDWRVAGGLVNSTQSFNTFEAILGNATSLPTGFIVLEHDLYEVTLKPIGTCSNIPTENLYAESNKNATFPYTNHTVVTSSNSNTSSPGTGSKSSQKHSNSARGGMIPKEWLIGGLICVWVFIEF
ncbi:hypothetical protein BJV77DRAFT_1040509 [Russula vinacea]|nr:hypothetical protein BJV77DRAFT_1040509 [Russula vinacea]